MRMTFVKSDGVSIKAPITISFNNHSNSINVGKSTSQL